MSPLTLDIQNFTAYPVHGVVLLSTDNGLRHPVIQGKEDMVWTHVGPRREKKPSYIFRR
jgi:hypothetical protein